eukprot:scaffold3084_cov144-Cylindrotheca_fusiformis.AAC.43
MQQSRDEEIKKAWFVLRTTTRYAMDDDRLQHTGGAASMYEHHPRTGGSPQLQCLGPLMASRLG